MAVDKERITAVLNLVRPSLQADGGDVQLIDISDDGVVTVDGEFLVDEERNGLDQLAVGIDFSRRSGLVMQKRKAAHQTDHCKDCKADEPVLGFHIRIYLRER